MNLKPRREPVPNGVVALDHPPAALARTGVEVARVQRCTANNPRAGAVVAVRGQRGRDATRRERETQAAAQGDGEVIIRQDVRLLLGRQEQQAGSASARRADVHAVLLRDGREELRVHLVVDGSHTHTHFRVAVGKSGKTCRKGRLARETTSMQLNEDKKLAPPSSADMQLALCSSPRLALEPAAERPARGRPSACWAGPEENMKMDDQPEK